MDVYISSHYFCLRWYLILNDGFVNSRSLPVTLIAIKDMLLAALTKTGGTNEELECVKWIKSAVHC